MNISEKDWKLFRNDLPNWQERYMEKLVEEYKEILSDDRNASDKYWALEARLKADKRNPGVLITDISRSNFYDHLVSLVRYKVITMDDLNDYSEETKEVVRRITG
ncbi:hypothetical protein [Butyrivibrio sp. MB2005]|uniref:hypothetical protein n=2 Tax=unclassified Butyrivibrio TaxID=2639466 RepID=UPI00041D9E4F|nr:hypothetical protein [Butyrivibrio sp. MB2005]